MNRILIVEDEETISGLIRSSLRRAGYDCTVASDGVTAADLIAEHDFDLALLDIMLPGLDGYELLEYLRPLGVPVIFITAKGTTRDRVRGLQLGADDYIVKPFEIEELLARVEAVLRRSGRGGQTLTAFDVTLDCVARQVTQNGRPVDLTPREFALLEQLMRNRGAALYRDVLYERVWGGELPDSRTLDLHIQRLRKKLNWSDKIETVYRVGYRLRAERKEEP
ncbi:MAG: response regulator transcription factor [Gemmiger sp.]|uniref:response regulator transcription factor n=1 Tax=Gemmiger sp. TaxID=2049027 RepID=UPI002E787168|nr:response regulator transcription factor [Gemmiger sp.]MEE0800589.1 response regulator transcription factor [Gemmiger sp.]